MKAFLKEIKDSSLLTLILAMLIFYSLVILVWNISNTEQQNKPSNVWADIDQEGYQVDPLKDRFKVK